MKTQDTIERLNNRLNSLYDEREELKLDLELAEGKADHSAIELIEEQIYELNHSVLELENQLKDAEVEHLEEMRMAI
jgi:prefoldin subunit 5